jgi:teichoic acid transport system ATP-binding protein
MAGSSDDPTDVDPMTAATEDEEHQDTLWVAPEESPLTVVAHRVRMRYKVPRTDRVPRPGLLGKLAPRRSMVSVSSARRRPPGA